MVRLQHCWIFAAVVLAIGAGSYAQSSPSAQLGANAAAVPAVNLPVAPGTSVAGAYSFPDGKQQFQASHWKSRCMSTVPRSGMT
jgi:hypothetical protein